MVTVVIGAVALVLVVGALGMLARRRARRAPGAAERDARLRWVVLRHDDTIVLTNRGATAVSGVRLAVSADGRTLVEGARALAGVGSIGPGASAPVVCPLTTETVWLGVEWTDPRHGELRAVLRTDVYSRSER